MRRCPGCGECKPLDDFPRNRRTASGHATYCKPCHRAKGKASRDKLGGARKYHLWRRYGLTLEAVDRLLQDQSGLCAICGVADPEHVDHCHQTGRVRGLLCFNCNGGLGQFKDDADMLRAAATYLDRAAQRTHPPVASRQDRRRTRRRPG